ncbi:MAG: hypothetical protein WC208_08560 [Gallionella sp.]|jgi:hypothetical protein
MEYLKTTLNYDWAFGLVISLLCIGVLYLLGKTGQFVRRGIELKKVLKNAKIEATTNGFQLNDLWFKYDRKATLFVLVPLLGWGGTYTYLAFILPLKSLLWSLIVLGVPLLGYFGIFFVPSDDGSDYIPHS